VRTRLPSSACFGNLFQLTPPKYHSRLPALQTAAPPPHEPASPGPGRTPLSPYHIHSQGDQRCHTRLSPAGHHTPRVPPTIQRPAQSDRLHGENIQDFRDRQADNLVGTSRQAAYIFAQIRHHTTSSSGSDITLALPHRAPQMKSHLKHDLRALHAVVAMSAFPHK
jgi:hypothetical protein